MQKQQNTGMIQNKVLQILNRINQTLIKSQFKQTVQLVAVSKTKTIQQILEVYNCGIRHFGENYVDQIQQKHDKLPKDIQWHFIGHLQSNKIKKVLVPNLYMIETVDRQSLAEKLNSQLQNQQKILNVMVQVRTSDQESKYGIQAEKAKNLIEYIINNCKNLKFKGLMTIGKQGDLQAFKIMHNFKKSLVEQLKITPQDFGLSMGMSADFQQAILQGSTSVRVGSLIFGPRNYKK